MAEATGVIPNALQKRPELLQCWHYAKEVFDALSGSRGYTMEGPCNIPITAFAVYAELYEIPRDDARGLWQEVKTIDDVWVVAVHAKAEKTRDKK